MMINWRRHHVAFAATACAVLWVLWRFTVRERWTPYAGAYPWRAVVQHYPLTSFRPLPTGQPRPLPAVQASFRTETTEERKTRLRRQGAIENAFLRCWKTYKKHAWLHDEVTPISLRPRDGFGGWSATLVDSLDTLWIMGLRDEFNKAVNAFVKHVTFETTATNKPISVFETSIRFLGGLLSAYELSGDSRLLSKARDVGDMLYKAFDTPSRLPIPRWDLEAASQRKKQSDPEQLLLAELGSHALEFTRLSLLTQDPKYYEIVARITDLLSETQMKTKVPGLWPTKVGITPDSIDSGDEYTFGAEADSTYEYTAKMIALLGGQQAEYEAMYSRSIDAAARHIFYRPLTPSNDDVLVSGTVRSAGRGKPPQLETSAQHLSCFAGGMLALGGRLTANKTHIELAKKLTHGCITLYKAVPSGIMPEACHITACPDTNTCDWASHQDTWHAAVAAKHNLDATTPAAALIGSRNLPPGFTDIPARYYLLRPEAIESIFVLYRVTADTALLEHGWEMWTAIERVTRTEHAYSALTDVAPLSGAPLPQSDSMESFWMAETLKYFWLLFAEPGVLSLDEWVLNTEAHPLRRLVAA